VQKTVTVSVPGRRKDGADDKVIRHGGRTRVRQPEQTPTEHFIVQTLALAGGCEIAADWAPRGDELNPADAERAESTGAGATKELEDLRPRRPTSMIDAGRVGPRQDATDEPASNLYIARCVLGGDKDER